MSTARVLSICGLVVLLGGCKDGAGQDPAPIYQAVLQDAFRGKDPGVAIYLFIEGQDPPVALLQTLRQQAPKLEAGSKAPPGRATRIDLSDLKVGRGSAELRRTVSNGIDGTVERFWLARKNGAWVVEKTAIEAVS